MLVRLIYPDERSVLEGLNYMSTSVCPLIRQFGVFKRILDGWADSVSLNVWGHTVSLTHVDG